MRRSSVAWGVLVVVVALAAAGVAALLVNIMERQREGRETVLRVVEIGQLEPDPAVWAQNFPRWADALRETTPEEQARYAQLSGKYGGSTPYSKLEKNPALKRMFAGMPFSVDYNEDRGHFFALKDAIATMRLGDKKPGSCLTCKTSDVVPLMARAGAPSLFYATPFNELVKDAKHPVSCLDCHDPQTTALRITRPALKEAMARRGVDLAKATRQEMRSLVCAQCHVEYYFFGPARYVVFPWTKGLTVDAIEAYYDEIKFSDWTHAESKAPLIKIQHPEYELHQTGVHAQFGVSCADCHMPYSREGAIKISDHDFMSPLYTLDRSCGTCHRGSEEEIRRWIRNIQDKTAGLLKLAEGRILEAIDAIKGAADAGVPDEALKEARSLHRRAQIRWDWIEAENSTGFHNPQEAARVLAEATDYARQAQIAAQRAAATAAKASAVSPIAK